MGAVYLFWYRYRTGYKKYNKKRRKKDNKIRIKYFKRNEAIRPTIGGISRMPPQYSSFEP